MATDEPAYNPPIASSGGGFTPGAAQRVPYGNAAADGLEDTEDFKFDAANWQIILTRGAFTWKLRHTASGQFQLLRNDIVEATFDGDGIGINGTPDGFGFNIGPSADQYAQCNVYSSNTNTYNLLRMYKSTDDLTGRLQLFGAGAGGTLFGTGVAGWFALYDSSDGIGRRGLKVGTDNPTPIVFGTNDVERGRFHESGALRMSTGYSHSTRFISDAAAAITINDGLVVSSALTADRAWTLPNFAAVPNGWEVTCALGHAAGGFKVTVSGDTNILGAATYDLNTDYESATFFKGPTVWGVK